MKNFPTNQPTPKPCLMIIGLVGILFSAPMVRADTVWVEKGRSPSGDVTKITPRAVTVTTRGGSEIEVPTNRIVSIHFTKDPRQLARAREAALSERFEDALEAMKGWDTSSLPGPLAADAAFIPAMAGARLALRGEKPLDEASDRMDQFVKDYPDSYHYYSAVRLAGDLLAAEGKFDSATESYLKLGKAPWPEYQADAKILRAFAFAEDDQTAASRGLLQQIAASDKLDATQTAKLELAEALCLMKENKPEQAIRLIEDRLKTLSPEEGAINARAYNLLGRAYRQAGRPRDAVLAFLHVDLLYGTDAPAHAEALGNLVELWREIHKPRRAQEAAKTLKQRYPFNRWSK